MLKGSRSSMLAVMTMLLTTTACASGGFVYRTPGPSRSAGDFAYRNGYDDGLRRGEGDARAGRSLDYRRHDAYRDADSGYGGRYGNRNQYRQLFREGFAAGYNDGYRRYARETNRSSRPWGSVYGGSPRTAPYGSPAAQVGYRDGFDQGSEDARKGDRFDPVRASRYRSGDHDYHNEYGSRDVYKREYREAFQEGYRRGYSGGR